MVQYLRSARMACLEKTNGGIFYLFPDIVIKICTLVPLIFIWRSVMLSGAKVDMTLSQMLTYTYLSAVLADLMVVKTAASGWLAEGVLLKFYGRPLSVLGQLAAQTIGGWLPMLALFSLPMTLAAPLVSVDITPRTLWFFPSLLLCVTLGFAMDFLFACLAIRLRNMSWLISRIRMAVVALLSGTVIPVKLLPFGIAEIMRFQPFAGLGGAPLSLFVGAGDVMETIALQLLWNLLLWPLAILFYRQSQERMVSYGG